MATCCLLQVQGREDMEKVNLPLNNEMNLYPESYKDSLEQQPIKWCDSISQFPSLVSEGYAYLGILLEDDFDGDGQKDYLLSVQATCPEKLHEYGFADETDRMYDCNFRGYVLVMSHKDRYKVTSSNYTCFLPEEIHCIDDLTYPMWLDDVSFSNGVLELHFFGALGGSGIRTKDYEFQYVDGDFVLIGLREEYFAGEDGETVYLESCNLKEGKLYVKREGSVREEAFISPRQIKLSEIVALPLY